MQSQTEARQRTRAKAKITVQSSEAKPYDQTASPALIEINLSEKFAGDIDGESPVRALQLVRADKSAALVSLQRFRGRLGEREGTFVLPGSEIECPEFQALTSAKAISESDKSPATINSRQTGESPFPIPETRSAFH